MQMKRWNPFAKPELWIFAGPNGAGKSTAINEIRAGNCYPIINPDIYAETLRVENPNIEADKVAYVSSRMALTARKELLKKRKTFGIETTFSSKHPEERLMRQAKKQGYKVTLVFIGLKTVEHSRKRVQERVNQGGHDIPLEAIYRRFPKIVANLPKAIHLSDDAQIFDNTDGQYQKILIRKKGKTVFVNEILPEWLLPECLEEGSEAEIAS
ncbi:zeta toxin family protein [Acetobacteraceae bacterium]|nr:zeta toxin family protein [Acetobacteraceae bacterium]